MGTAVLRSHDCLKGRFPAGTLISPPLKPRRNPNPNPNSNPTRSCRRKRSPSGIREKENRGSRCGSNAAKVPAKNLVMGQVTILKRGELLEPTEDRTSEVGEKEAKIGIAEVPVLCSTDRLGPEPEMIPKQIGLTDLKPGDGVFAGSGFFSSPPPSCLPFPAFFTKKIGPSKNDAATTDLRRLLRLDLP